MPRSELRKRIGSQKQESYKSCYDQSCQIDIGRELAAQKSLATELTRIGDQCMVTAVIYDLRRSASEGGADADGGCSDGEVLKMLNRVVRTLAQR